MYLYLILFVFFKSCTLNLFGIRAVVLIFKLDRNVGKQTVDITKNSPVLPLIHLDI